MLITDSGRQTIALTVRDYLRTKATSGLLYMKFGIGVGIDSFQIPVKRVQISPEDVNGVEVVYNEEQTCESGFTKVRITSVLEDPIYNNSQTTYTEFGLVIYDSVIDADNDGSYSLYFYGTHEGIMLSSVQSMYVKNAYINF